MMEEKEIREELERTLANDSSNYNSSILLSHAPIIKNQKIC